MATLKEIRTRITSVKNTQKITKAMKMVAAAKLRRAQNAVQGGRPYIEKLSETITQISERLSKKDTHFLFKARDEVKNVKVFVFSSNRGLCGGFNSNLLKRLEAFLQELKAQEKNVTLVVVGRKGRDYMNARGYQIDQFVEDWAEKMTFEQALGIAKGQVAAFENKDIDECYFVYSRFVSAMTQEPTVEKLVPVVQEEGETEDSFGIDFLYEPSKKEILDDLLPRYLGGKVHSFHKESLASELGARMTAMDSATNNASDMLGSLTLQYNRARQAAITVELLDIVNGAEALDG